MILNVNRKGVKNMKLYDLYPYEKQFEANVISCTACQQGYDVILDQTLFFPEEGGQNCDQGTINGHVVDYVSIQDDVIHHFLKQSVEGKVKGEINFAYRYSNMQNHSGEHILSGLINQFYGYHNVGFHLGDHEITTDYDGFLNKKQLDEIEKKVNQVIFDNLPIYCSYPENIKDLEYRSKKEIDGDIRIVEIPGVDRCACCAPHVATTGEIGVFKIVKAIKHKQGMRVYFLCGQKAIEDYQLKHEEVMHISNLLSAPVYQISSYVEKLLKENNDLKQQISLLKKEMIDQQCQSMKKDNQHIIFVEDMDRHLQQYYVSQLLLKSEKMAAVFVGKDNQYRFLLVSHYDARDYLNILKKHFDVKGGGKKEMVQGTIVATKQDIMDIFEK